jgi:hypothetical protein
MSGRNNRKRGDIDKLAIMRRMREEEEMRKQKEMERMRRMQSGVIFTIGQDGPFDRVVDVEPFVPPVRPMTLQDYENSEKEKADLLEFKARLNFRDEALANSLNDNLLENRHHRDRLEDSFEKYDMSDFEGGQRKKRKYKQTQTRQKKQHRRRHRRRSTRKYKK